MNITLEDLKAFAKRFSESSSFMSHETFNQSLKQNLAIYATSGEQDKYALALSVENLFQFAQLYDRMGTRLFSVDLKFPPRRVPEVY